jgi:hypothetical protein
MAATLCRCEWCGSDFVASRKHARWCSDACRKAAKRSRTKTLPGWPRDFDRAEEALIVQIRRGEAEPLDALNRILDALVAA